jgi:hypothetical protein
VPRGITRVKASSMLENTAVAGNIANASLNNITAIPTSIDVGSMTLLQTQTASSSATIDFTSNIDSTYDSYVFKFINIHPSSDGAMFRFNLSTDGGSNYNVTKTTTAFLARHSESGTGGDLQYKTGEDLAQSTSDQIIGIEVGADADQNVNGTLQLFNPSSTTFVKHFIMSSNGNDAYSDFNYNFFVAGYGNTTSSINAVRFLFSTGNIDSGVIKLYGIK